MAISNFSELKTAVADWLDRDDLTSKIPDFISLAEARHAREIKLRAMITRDTSTLSTTTRFEDLPTGYTSIIRLMLDTTPETILEQVSAYELTRRVEAASGKPLFFCVHTQIEFDRTPDSAYTLERLYYAKFTALSDSNTTNNLLTNHPDIYLYSALAAAAPFLDEDERLGVWEGLYRQAKDDAMAADRDSEYSRMPLHSQPSGPTP